MSCIFKENYLAEIPDDILEMIDMYWREDYYNIYVNAERDYLCWRYNKFIDDQLHKSVSSLHYVYNAGANSTVFANRQEIAYDKMKNHIDNIVKYMKKQKVKKIMRDNNIYNAKKIYEKKNPGNNNNVSNYDKALLSQFILSAYYPFVYTTRIER